MVLPDPAGSAAEVFPALPARGGKAIGVPVISTTSGHQRHRRRWTQSTRIVRRVDNSRLTWSNWRHIQRVQAPRLLEGRVPYNGCSHWLEAAVASAKAERRRAEPDPDISVLPALPRRCSASLLEKARALHSTGSCLHSSVSSARTYCDAIEMAWASLQVGLAFSAGAGYGLSVSASSLGDLYVGARTLRGPADLGLSFFCRDAARSAAPATPER